MTKIEIGSVCEGTLRTEDLIEAFSDELARHAGADYANLISDCVTWLENEERSDDDDVTDEVREEHQQFGSEIVSELIDALSAIAPPYTYFGTLQGDGACYGFWPSIDSLEEDARFGDDVIKVNDSSEIQDNWTGTAMIVNDHGNVVCANVVAGKVREIWWSCV